MRTLPLLLSALAIICGSLGAATAPGRHPLWQDRPLPELYFQVLSASADSALALQAPDGRLRDRRYGSAAEELRQWTITGMQYIYVPALLYGWEHPANPRRGDRRLLELASRAGDYLVACVQEDGTMAPRIDGQEISNLDAHRTMYCWTEALELLGPDLDPARREAWRQALLKAGTVLAGMVERNRDRPRYVAPFLGTSPNHFGLWSSTLLRMGQVLDRPDWVSLTTPALQRFVREVAPGGYWPEHDGPTMNYDYLNSAVAALWWHYSADPAAWSAMAANTDFHLHWCTPDGVDIPTVDQRNRSDFAADASFGLFTFTHFPEGRRFARFKLLAALEGSLDPLEKIGLHSLARLAQDAHYYENGPEAESIPQERQSYRHLLDRPAVVRKSGPWVWSMSALVSVDSPRNQFFLDRIAPVSLWHQGPRHLLGGGNSKGQPELATFAVRRANGSLDCHVLDALLRGGPDSDTMCVALEGYSFRLVMTALDDSRLELAALAERTYDVPDSCFLNLPLILHPGMRLAAGSGPARTLGREPLLLTGDRLGGSLAVGGWRVEFPAGARFRWPYYTYTPYGPVRVPERLEAAVGVLTLPLYPTGQWQRLIFTADNARP